MKICVSLIRDETLICGKEKYHLYDLYPVSIVPGNIIVGEILENICAFLWKFLSLPNTSISDRVIDKPRCCV